MHDYSTIPLKYCVTFNEKCCINVQLYISPRMQNELLNILGRHIGPLRSVVHEIRTVKFYKRLSILADEVTSHNTEHLEPAHGCWLSNIMVRFGTLRHLVCERDYVVSVLVQTFRNRFLHVYGCKVKQVFTFGT